jgi:acyl-coenzyme A synthetase/AMP-(fatty) acid ligase
MRNIVGYLGYRALADARRVALIDDHRTISFAQLASIVAGAAIQLRARGVRPGQVVMTELPEKSIDWVLTLALMHEGAVTCSADEALSGAGSIRPDWRVRRRGAQRADIPEIIIDQRWLDAATAARASLDPFEFAADQPFRLLETSGTTGSPKAVALGVDAVQRRVESQLIHFGALPTWNPLPLRSVAGFHSAVTALMTGRPLICVTDLGRVGGLIDRGAIEAIYASPSQLAAIAQGLPARGAHPTGLKVVSFTGVEPSPAQIAMVHARLCTEIVGFYGASEVGRVCMRRLQPGADMTDVGHALPGCSVDVVDDRGAPVPRGTIGSIRLHSPHMVLGYYGDPAGTAAAFRDGWFQPGDRGMLRDDGSLVLAGREREVLNRDGVKLDPAALDRFLRTQGAVLDAASFAFPHRSGVQGLGVALVCSAPPDVAQLGEALRARFGKAGVPDTILHIAVIPRNAAGKVDRRRLAQMLENRQAAAG